MTLPKIIKNTTFKSPVRHKTKPTSFEVQHEQKKDNTVINGAEYSISIRISGGTFTAVGNIVNSKNPALSKGSSVINILKSQKSAFAVWLKAKEFYSNPRQDRGTVGKFLEQYIDHINSVAKEIAPLKSLGAQIEELEQEEFHISPLHRTQSGSSSINDVWPGMNSVDILVKLNPYPDSFLELMIYGSIQEFQSDSTLDDPANARKAESPKKPTSASSTEEVRKLQHELKKVQQELQSLKNANNKLEEEGVRLRKVAMSDTVMSTPSHPPQSSSPVSVRAFPPVVYIVAAILLGLIIGKFLL